MSETQESQRPIAIANLHQIWVSEFIEALGFWANLGIARQVSGIRSKVPQDDLQMRWE